MPLRARHWVGGGREGRTLAQQRVTHRRRKKGMRTGKREDMGTKSYAPTHVGHIVKPIYLSTNLYS